MWFDSGLAPICRHQRWLGNKKSVPWFEEDQRKYFCGASGMTALAKDLAEGQYLQVNEKVICLQKSENGIQISCESGRQSKAIYPEAFVKLEAGLIYLAGDAFGGGSIAGAVRSAKAVFAAIPRVP